MAQLNLFEFFSEAAEIYAGRINLDKSSEAQESAFLKSAYFSSSRVKYDSALRKYVYLKLFAPRHAIIWRTLMSASPHQFPDMTLIEDALCLNAVGPGPGSEIVGILEGLSANRKALPVRVACCETEASWEDVGQIVALLYQRKTGRSLTLTYSTIAGHLYRSVFVVGSMVISDLAREGTIRTVLDDIRKAVSPARAWFVDTTQYTTSAGATPFLSDEIPHALRDHNNGYYVNFSKCGLVDKLSAVIDAEMEAAQHGDSSHASTGLKMNLLPLKF